MTTLGTPAAATLGRSEVPPPAGNAYPSSARSSAPDTESRQRRPNDANSNICLMNSSKRVHPQPSEIDWNAPPAFPLFSNVPGVYPGVRTCGVRRGGEDGVRM